jgi:hypothetical protein
VHLGDRVFDQARLESLDVTDAVGKFVILPSKWFKWGGSDRIPIGYASRKPHSHAGPPMRRSCDAPHPHTPCAPHQISRWLELSCSVTAQIMNKKRADKPAFNVKMYDGVMPYYVSAHPKPKQGEEDVYLTHKDVIVLEGEPL